MTKDQINAAALMLSPTDRAELAEELLLSIPQEDHAAIDEAWMTEVRRRDAAYAAGKSKARPVDEVIARLRSRRQ